MSRRDAVADDVPVGRCSQCNKLTYTSRRGARRANSRMRWGGTPLSIYRCPHNDGWWHLGHVPQAVRQGRLPKDEYEERIHNKNL